MSVIADASWPGEQVDKSLVPMSRMTISGSKSRTSESCVRFNDSIVAPDLPENWTITSLGFRLRENCIAEFLV